MSHISPSKGKVPCNNIPPECLLLIELLEGKAHSAGVSRRVTEIGVRMALGARAEQVFRRVLGEAIGLALGGVVAGLCAALLLSRLLTSMLFGLKPTDSVTLATAGLLLSIAALFAAWVPARRAFPH